MSEPEFMEMCNITSLYKGKGERSSLENERGIFILPILRMIKDRLIYNDIYDTVDRNMSDSQVGGRTKRSIRDHLFVLHSVINSVIEKELPCIDLQFFDVKSCFDSLWTEECCNDLFEAGIKDDKLAMVYMGNMENKVAISTPLGLSDRVSIPNIVCQGGVMGSLLCGIQTDRIGRNIITNNDQEVSPKKTLFTKKKLIFLALLWLMTS